MTCISERDRDGSKTFLIMNKRDNRAFNILTDKAESFVIEGENGEDITLYLWPLQLGRLMMISQRLMQLDLSLSGDHENDVKKMWELCATQTQTVAEIIAISTLRTKEEIDTQLDERINLIMHSPSMTPIAFANLLMNIIFQSYYADFTKAIRLAKTFQVTISPMTEMERIASTEAAAYGGK